MSHEKGINIGNILYNFIWHEIEMLNYFEYFSPHFLILAENLPVNFPMIFVHSSFKMNFIREHNNNKNRIKRTKIQEEEKIN